MRVIIRGDFLSERDQECANYVSWVVRTSRQTIPRLTEVRTDLDWQLKTTG